MAFSEQQDAFGRMLLDRLAGQDAVEVVERDRFVMAGGGDLHLAPVQRWPSSAYRAWS